MPAFAGEQQIAGDRPATRLARRISVRHTETLPNRPEALRILITMPRRSTVFFTAIVILAASLWIWDHWRLREELQELRQAIVARTAQTPSANATVQENPR